MPIQTKPTNDDSTVFHDWSACGAHIIPEFRGRWRRAARHFNTSTSPAVAADSKAWVKRWTVADHCYIANRGTQSLQQGTNVESNPKVFEKKDVCQSLRLLSVKKGLWVKFFTTQCCHNITTTGVCNRFGISVVDWYHWFRGGFVPRKQRPTLRLGPLKSTVRSGFHMVPLVTMTNKSHTVRSGRILKRCLLHTPGKMDPYVARGDVLHGAVSNVKTSRWHMQCISRAWNDHLKEHPES